jgi:oligopeptide transport system substrate-binding protein
MLRRSIIGSLGVSLLFLALQGCGSIGPFFGKTSPPGQQVIYINNGTEPRTLDPNKTASVQDGNIIQNLFESLTVYDSKTLEPRPGMAERWEAQNDARRWIFYLRKDARWSDGQPVTAHDFTYAWQRAIAPDTACPYSYLLYYIKNGEAIAGGKMDKSSLGVRALDDYTLEVEMEKPTAFFVQMTSAIVFSPLPRWVIEKGEKTWTKVGNLVNNGPFLLSEYKPYDRIVIVKNPNYWDAGNVHLEKAVFFPVTDQGTNLNLYKAGEIDVMVTGLVPQAFTKAVIEKRDFIRGPALQTFYFSLNVKRKPLDDNRIRRALNLAINKKLLVETLYAGRGIVPAYNFTPPGMPGYIPKDDQGFNPEEARRLLAEAGFPDGKGFPKITVYFPTHAGNKRLVEAIQQLWRESLNITVELQNEEFQTYMARTEKREFDICYDGWNGDYIDPTTFLDLFTTDNPANHPGWVSPRYKELIGTANSELDQVRRMALLGEAEALMLSDAPIIPIYHVAVNYMKKPYVMGWEHNLLDQHPLKFVWIDTKWHAD